MIFRICKPSVYFEDPTIRDMIFKGYTILYKVYKNDDYLLVFGLVKHQEGI